MAALYNEKVKVRTAKKSVLSYLNELDDVPPKELKNIKKLFVEMWSDELLLRKLSNESFTNIQGLIDPNLQTKIDERRQQADKKYGGDFAKVQLEAVRFAVQSVPASEKVKLQQELDKPLKNYNSTAKRQRLVKAIGRFQVDEKNSTSKQ
ncbi:unnamed protein product [Auanema sp. JU1783]|nr:unnamed protein product [Auanema sp. JU1783]